MYGLPCNAPTVLHVMAAASATTAEMTHEAGTLGGPWLGEEKWEGGVMDRASGVIYAMPQQATRVLKIDPGAAAAGAVGGAGGANMA